MFQRKRSMFQNESSGTAPGAEEEKAGAVDETLLNELQNPETL